MNGQRQRVVFVCTGNACRSQMAEAWTRHLLLDRFEAFSAGTAPQNVDPRAIAVMREEGIDISRQQSKSIASLATSEFDLVVTVCDKAATSCPTIPGALQYIHHGFSDPPEMANSAHDEEQALQAYREVRDQIRDFVLTLGPDCS